MCVFKALHCILRNNHAMNTFQKLKLAPASAPLLRKLVQRPLHSGFGRVRSPPNQDKMLAVYLIARRFFQPPAAQTPNGDLETQPRASAEDTNCNRSAAE
jgi:hypothetical protein